jgi:phage shock protein A
MSEKSEPIDAEIVPDPPPPTTAPASAPPPSEYDEHGVPSFDYVRDKIESRYATSIGATELAAETTDARTLEQQEAERAKAAAAKLEEIRKTLRPR